MYLADQFGRRPVGSAAGADGKHTVMYIEGCPTVDNPTLIQSTGITQLGVGDVRIVNRPLPVGEFMLYQ